MDTNRPPSKLLLYQFQYTLRPEIAFMSDTIIQQVNRNIGGTRDLHNKTRSIDMFKSPTKKN